MNDIGCFTSEILIHREGLRERIPLLKAIVTINLLNCDDACFVVLPPFNVDYTFELRSDYIIITKGPCVGL